MRAQLEESMGALDVWCPPFEGYFTLKDQDGETETIDCGPEVKRFDDLKVPLGSSARPLARPVEVLRRESPKVRRASSSAIRPGYSSRR
jgi:hypothetical protein